MIPRGFIELHPVSMMGPEKHPMLLSVRAIQAVQSMPNAGAQVLLAGCWSEFRETREQIVSLMMSAETKA